MLCLLISTKFSATFGPRSSLAVQLQGCSPFQGLKWVVFVLQLLVCCFPRFAVQLKLQLNLSFALPLCAQLKLTVEALRLHIRPVFEYKGL